MNTQSLLKVPGYQYNEYLLVLYPNTDLSDKILEIKKTFSDEFNTGPADLFRPALTLVNFIQFDLLEERLINRVNTITAGIRPAQIELNGFGSFPSHTIYFNVAYKQTLQNLSKEFLAARQLMTLNKEFKPHFIKDPHFIVARKLLPWQYEKAWLLFSNQHFTGRFIAGEIALLKKPLNKSSASSDAKNKFQVVKRFNFQNIPVTSNQGNLFA